MIKPIIYKEADFSKLDKSLQEIVTKQFSKGKGVFLCGKAGVGKTHTAWAISDMVEARSLRTDFYKVNKIMFWFRNINDNDSRELLEEMVGDGSLKKNYLFLDDFGSNKESEFTLDCMTMILDYRYENKLPTVITSNASFDELLENVGARVYSRLIGMCKEVEITGKDRRNDEI